MSVKPLFLGNWKMHMLPAETVEFAKSFLELFKVASHGEPDCGFAPTYTSITALREALGDTPGVLLGAQNAHWTDSGAHTGEISVPMLDDLGVQFVIVGHSERRQFYGETDEGVAKRAKAVLSRGLLAVVCIGETQAEFEAGSTAQVVESQFKGSLSGIEASEISKLIIAYEPVWAIGTGLAATPEIAAGVHNQIRTLLTDAFGEAGQSVPILYGGSTKPENVGELLAQENINGALVGGASLKPDVFAALIENGRKAKGI